MFRRRVRGPSIVSECASVEQFYAVPLIAYDVTKT